MSMGEESNRRLEKGKTFFQYGNDAALKSNHDYAIQMYKEACKLEPENLRYRQALRGIARRKFGNDPSKVGRLVGARVQPLRMSARSAKGKGNFAQALTLCEDAFTYNPWDVGTARDAADAAEGLELKELAQWLLESVHAQGEADADFLRHEAHVHEINEAWQKAISCWERVMKVDPNDQNARRRANDLSARATIQRSGLGEAIAKAQGGSGPENLPPDVEELKRNALTPEQRYHKEIAENPTQIGPYLSLADHYKLESRLDEAEQILAKGLKAAPEDQMLKSAHADVQMQRLRRAEEAWSRKLKKAPDDAEARSKLEQITAALAAYEIKEIRRRIALRADDMNLRFQLGQALAKAGKHGEAIAEFQQARNSPQLKVQALYQAGLSFEANGVPKLAERSYQDAVRATEPDDTATMNSLHYRLGRIAELQGNTQSAEEHYNEVAANDYSYLDVAERLGNLNKKPAED
jgi:tetratricopeptide (TPR) repeat protein